MSFFMKLISAVVLLENKFKSDPYLEGPPVISHHPSYLIVSYGEDEWGRPNAIVESRSYRDVPNFGTYPGYQVHTKLEKELLWHVHYEDFNLV